MKWDFWVILSLLVGIILFLMTNMATKSDIAATQSDIAELKADMREIRGLIITHITEGHKRHPHPIPAQKNKTTAKNIK